MRRMIVYAVVVTVLCAAASASADDPNVYYGLLHAHTSFSDGSGLPVEAYDQAKAAGLDFFAITEHNHSDAEAGAKERKDGLLIATDRRLYNGQQPIEINGRAVASVLTAAKAASSDRFVALYGQEFSTISSGNHVNVFDTTEVIDVPSGNFRRLYDYLGAIKISDGGHPIVQFNHPDVHGDLFYAGTSEKSKKDMDNDYGIDQGDLGPSFATVADACDSFASLIEMLSGPAMAKEQDSTFRYAAHEEDYAFYLSQGFHLSPTAGQDNHYKTWGTVTNARTGVLCERLTKNDLLEALRLGRTFATEDKNLALTLTANDQLMGSRLSLPEKSLLDLAVTIRDADEPHTSYHVNLYHGIIETTTRDRAREVKLRDLLAAQEILTGDGNIHFKGVETTGKPEFFFVKVEQADHDRAWSAPVWVNSGTLPDPATSVAMYVWNPNSRSKIYHTPDCRRGPTSEGKQSGPVPPADFHPHECVIQTHTDEP